MLEVFPQGCLLMTKDGGPKNVFRDSETVVQACCLGALLQGNLDELFGRETPNADILRFFSFGLVILLVKCLPISCLEDWCLVVVLQK